MSLRIGKHGVNPSVEICFICGKETGSILLLGLNGGKEAPRHMATGNMCDECKAVVDTGGVLLVEVHDGQEGSKNPTRTGHILGVKREVIDADVIKDSPMAFMPESDMKQLLGELYQGIFNEEEKKG